MFSRTRYGLECVVLAVNARREDGGMQMNNALDMWPRTCCDVIPMSAPNLHKVIVYGIEFTFFDLK